MYGSYWQQEHEKLDLQSGSQKFDFALIIRPKIIFFNYTAFFQFSANHKKNSKQNNNIIQNMLQKNKMKRKDSNKLNSNYMQFRW